MFRAAQKQTHKQTNKQPNKQTNKQKTEIEQKTKTNINKQLKFPARFTISIFSYINFIEIKYSTWEEPAFNHLQFAQ